MFFFFNDTATTEIYTLSLHDALPISAGRRTPGGRDDERCGAGSHRAAIRADADLRGDRKSTRLNSSHGYISYAVFCLKKKKQDIAFYAMHDESDETRPIAHANLTLRG